MPTTQITLPNICNPKPQAATILDGFKIINMKLKYLYIFGGKCD